MESQIKNNFILNQGIGRVSFSDNELVIKDKIGIPDLEKKDLEVEDFTINLSYNVLDLDCFVHYENYNFSYTSFHTTNLTIDRKLLKDLTEKECIKFIKMFHLKNNINYLINIDVDDLEKKIDFENVGITIWFSNNKISDISIGPIW